ncbi:hypothetical protein MsAg5_15520 [Methanosarcinaceae archaeon Ag5]|uniref:Uncharacterized protein n=1 Tax=Methanolapillus africanus TaxID=3028297 RepID=A0AAE4ML43_9EURY|nr:hypothetical protein [Methanosarcinaceae archaeon Ag5]
MFLDWIISTFNLLPYDDQNAAAYYNFLLAITTFLFFLATLGTIVLSYRTSKTANKALKIANVEHITSEIQFLEKKIEMEKGELNYLLNNKEYFGDILDHGIFTHENEVHLQLDVERVLLKLEDMRHDSRNFYLYNYKTGTNPLDSISEIMYYYSDYFSAKNFSNLIDELYNLTSDEINTLKKNILVNENKLEKLNLKKEKLE